MILENLSWSKEDRYWKCGQQFVYVYGEKLKRPPGIALVRGLAPHRSTEADLKAKIDTGALLPREAVGAVATDYVDLAFKGEVLIDGEFKGMPLKQARATCREDARKMAWWHHDEFAPSLNPTGLELKVEANFPDLPIPYVGIIDVVDGDVDVHDLKTKRKAPNGDMAETSGQLTVYWGLFSALKGRPPERLFFDVVWVTPTGKTNGKPLATTRTADDLAAHFLRSLVFLKAVEAEVFLPCAPDAWVCNPKWCGFTDICPYFRGRDRPTS